MRSAAALGLATALVLSSTIAQATPTSWLAFGLGAAWEYDNLDHRGVGNLALAGEVGVGTSSTHPIVVGALFRSLTSLNLGTDISLSARVATAGFVRGEWGAALDLGVAARWWGRDEYGHFPLQAVAIFGCPAGLQLELGADVWDVAGESPTAKSGFALLAFDFFKLATRNTHSQKGFWSDPPPPPQVTVHDH